MYLFDLTHTAHCEALTGIQRASRSIYHEFKNQGPSIGICYDPYFEGWRKLTPKELAYLDTQREGVGLRRKSFWTWGQRLNGIKRKFFRTPEEIDFKKVQGLIVAEIFKHSVIKQYTELFEKIKGPKIAIFYDLIALQLPEFAVKKTVSNLAQYAKDLLMFDGVVAISESSRETLQDYWKFLGAKKQPHLRTLRLGNDFFSRDLSATNSRSAFPSLLCVGTWEGRKNHFNLLRAAEVLWKEGLQFELRLIGMLHETGAAAFKLFKELRDEGFPLEWEGTVTDDKLKWFYKKAYCTIYPSLKEGYGLPVIESLSFGVPCICSDEGALGEISKSGGCLTCNTADIVELTAAIKKMLTDSSLRDALAKEAQQRKFSSWEQYAEELKKIIAEVA